MTESTFVSIPGSLADQIDLGYRQLYAYTMRHFLAMPRETEGDELLTKPRIKADKAILRRFTDLAERLGFHSQEIIVLKQYSCPPAV
jgi:hypothetical protein